ncbi:MAG: DegT/DnrJ/EryC1/StrS family aminotransferase [Thermogemmatispora sp.]|uniref:DegT/DnrJ/EryC1/StrS family aminotransferase n=1 Tax=Thermogemmatispora sp. TaxID=1968838 RepID=UPI00261456E9|nr:DegT/DnrJ/EryC1/StrS family aminotransferase [Thermogemmatispora sp.]MBX5455405.1 DegT/DnrJ/EryC1/StrS family aminotransferase [Thermogemmatispora sp.]
MHIPLVDLQAQYQTIKEEVQAALDEVLADMELFLGPRTLAFEEAFATYCGCRYGIGVSSGTDALTLALRACGIGPGDEVITVANTFIATIEAIAQVGARPVFVDIDPQTYTLDPAQVSAALTPRTRALLPVHLYGHPAEMEPLLAIARRAGLRVIEDASQAHGATYQGRRVGSLGDIGCFSLYYSKNLGAYGEAGICVTNDAALAERLRMLRDHGSRVRYHHELLGSNARLDELQAAVLLVKLRYLERWNAARQSHAHFYSEHLHTAVAALPVTRAWATHVYCYYVIQVEQRDQFRRLLEQAGISTGIHYPHPLHLQPACSYLGYQRGDLPQTEACAARVVSLPMYPELTEQQLTYVVETVHKSLAQCTSVADR